MKIVDEKGRIFGKINVIDFLAVLFLVWLISMFYFGYKLFKKPVISVPRSSMIIEIDCKFTKVNPQILKLITVGDKEINEKGEVIGEIVWVGKNEPYQYKFNIGPDKSIIKEDSKLKELPVRLKINANSEGDNLYYKDKQIISDSAINFKTEKYSVTAILVSTRIEKVDLNIIFKNLTEDTLKLISVGDKEIGEDGDTISEILKIGKVENNLYEINLGAGNIVLGEDSNKKQVFVKMKLKSKIDEAGRMYFKGRELKYDSFLKFDMGKYTVEGKVANILVNEKWVEVKVKFTGVIPELAAVINEGDVEKDPSGRLEGRLKTIVSNKPSEVQAIRLEQNKFVTIPQPFQRDIVAILNLLCIEKEGVLYFKNYPIKIGNIVTFTTNLYNIQGVAIGLEDS